MPTIPEQLNSLTVRDTFSSSSDPFSSANWTKPSWCSTSGKVEGGAGNPILQNKWTPKSLFAEGEDGVYWNAAEFTDPAVLATLSGKNFSKERWIALWAALNTSTHSGYRLKIVSLEEDPTESGGGKHEWLLQKVVEGTATTLKSGTIEGLRDDKLALVAVGGVVSVWRQVNGAGEWTEVTKAEDSTYTKGRVAIEGRGTGEHTWDNVAADTVVGEPQRYIYWAETSKIGRAKIDGTGGTPTWLEGVGSFVWDVAIDGTYIYWVNKGNAAKNAIGRAKLDGTSVEPTWIPELGEAVLWVEVDAGHVYWSNEKKYGEHGIIGRAKIDGTSVEKSFVAGEGEGWRGMALDGTYLYIIRRAGGSSGIARVKLDGTGLEEKWIAVEPETVAGLAVDKEYIYWTYEVGGTGQKIGRAKIDGSSPNNSWVNGLPSAQKWGLAVDDAYVYCSHEAAISRVKRDGTGLENEWLTAPNEARGLTVTPAEEAPPEEAPTVKTEEATEVGETSAKLNGKVDAGGAKTNFWFQYLRGEPAWLSGILSPAYIAVNATHIYYSSPGTNDIGRAKLDGTSLNSELITGQSGVRGIAIDGTYIYWCHTGGAIGRAKLDGTEVNAEFITEVGTLEPEGLAVDSGHIYWSHHNNIGRAKIDGTSPESEWASVGIEPTGLTVDATYLYYVNGEGADIGRMKLDGTGITDEYIKGAGFGIGGVAVDSEFIFWTNQDKIGVAKLDGTVISKEWLDVGSGLKGIAAPTTGLYFIEANALAVGRALYRYAPTSKEGNAGSGTTEEAHSEKVEELEKASTYHFRIGASNAKGSAEGEWKTFTTTGGAAKTVSVMVGGAIQQVKRWVLVKGELVNV